MDTEWRGWEGKFDSQYSVNKSSGDSDESDKYVGSGESGDTVEFGVYCRSSESGDACNILVYLVILTNLVILANLVILVILVFWIIWVCLLTWQLGCWGTPQSTQPSGIWAATKAARTRRRTRRLILRREKFTLTRVTKRQARVKR